MSFVFREFCLFIFPTFQIIVISTHMAIVYLTLNVCSGEPLDCHLLKINILVKLFWLGMKSSRPSSSSSLLNYSKIEFRFVAKIYGTWKSTDREYVDELLWFVRQRKHWNCVGFMYHAPPYIYFSVKLWIHCHRLLRVHHFHLAM